MVSVVAEVAVGIGKVTLGGGIKALGDGVQAGRVSNGKPSNSIATKVVGVSLGISRPLAVVVSVVAEMVSVETMGIGKVSLGGDIKALGDGVQARRVSEGNGGNNGSVGVSGPLAVVVGNGKSSLGHWVKPLGDGIQTGGGSEGNTSVGIAMGIGKGPVVPIEGIGLGLDGHNKGGLKENEIRNFDILENILITHSEKRLEHVASLLTQTENTDFEGCGAFIGTGRAGTLTRRGMSARERCRIREMSSF